jgi:hypothetical protein
MRRRSFIWVALVPVAVAGVVAVSAATALGARSTASPFDLVVQGHQELIAFDGVILDARLVATFTSGSSFCESGTAEPLWAGDDVRRFTCSDGSGSLTLGITNPQAEVNGGEGEWTIVEGSGRYAGLRGRGTYREELLDEDPEDLVVPFRTTFHGFVDPDAVAPSLAFTSASVTKLRRSKGWYTIRVSLSVRDDVERNPVAYRLTVREGLEHPRDRVLLDLASQDGTTASGSVSTTLRIHPSSKRVRSVALLLIGSDPNGNEMMIARSLKLPR